MNGKPKKIARVSSSNDATTQGWWYENARSIEVFLRDADRGQTYSGRIPRAQIMAWLERTKK